MYCSELTCYQYSILDNLKCTIHSGQLLRGGDIELDSKSTLDMEVLAIEGSDKTTQEQEQNLNDEDEAEANKTMLRLWGEQEREQKLKADANERLRLAALFPGLDSNLELIEIKEMLEQGYIIKERAPPRFFDGMLYVVEQNWKLCANLFTIDIEIIPEEKYDGNIFRVSSVLNEIIARSNIQSLTLKYFPRNLLLDSLATLSESEQLDYLDVSHNSLKRSGLHFVFRLLPNNPIVPIDFNFEHNDITDEDDVGEMFRFRRHIKSVKIADQGSRKLDLARIREHMVSIC